MALRRARRLIAAAAAAAAATAAAPLAVLTAAAPAAHADLAQQCEDSRGALPVAGQQACRSILATEWGTAAACRLPLYETGDPTAPDACAAIDERPVSLARVDAYQGTWVHRALTLQRQLSSLAPLSEAVIPHTHNSFNANSYRLNSTYYATLTNQDPNQAYSLYDQLRMDIRAVEIDMHWMPSHYGAAESGGYEVTACHGTSQALPGDQHFHIGCTIDRPFWAPVDELAAWLAQNPDELVVVYLENQMDGSPAAHERAAQVLTERLGSLIYRPPADQPCADFPVATRPADILATGARVLLVGNCDAANGAATAWGGLVHTRGPNWDESGDPTGYGDDQCAADLSGKPGQSFRRYYEEITWLQNMGDTAPPATSALGHHEAITADATARMVRCGVNIIGLDQLIPEDPRLPALVWSWAPDQPAAPGCAYQGADTRFRSSSCDGPERAFACFAPSTGWHATAATGEWSDGFAACPAEFPGSTFATPLNGWRNAELADAAAGAEVWLNYAADAAGAWQANQPGATAPSAAPPPAASSGTAALNVARPSAPAAAPRADLRAQPAGSRHAARWPWALLALLLPGIPQALSLWKTRGSGLEGQDRGGH